jgi:rare lipoprotein A
MHNDYFLITSCGHAERIRMNRKIITNLLIILLIGLLTSCYDNTHRPQSLHATSTRASKTLAVNKTITTKYKKVTYTVFGKSYKVLPTSRNYREVGVASWYGKPFHHRYTSSGERYNMFKLTAAHKTLPLSTYVLVTNLKNNKHVVVKINDRGPFVGKRVIDLSYAAAKRLGMVGVGVTAVSIKALSGPTPVLSA